MFLLSHVTLETNFYFFIIYGGGIFVKILFLGGDKRQLEIIKYLQNFNHEIYLLGYDNIEINKCIKVQLNDLKLSDYEVLIFPVSGVNEDFSVISDFSNDKIVLNSKLFMDLSKNTLLITGIKTKNLNLICESANKEAIALMEYESIKEKNSIPTVEGIIADIINNTETTVNNSKIFIIGYGHVGKQLAEKLKSLGAFNTIGVLTKEEANEVIKKDMFPILTNDNKSMSIVFANSDIIINTVPSLIINKEYLNLIDADSYILDISSYPYGVDFNTAKNLNLKYKLYTGIPAKVAPKTAGDILAKEIDSILRRKI